MKRKQKGSKLNLLFKNLFSYVCYVSRSTESKQEKITKAHDKKELEEEQIFEQPRSQGPLSGNEVDFLKRNLSVT